MLFFIHPNEKVINKMTVDNSITIYKSNDYFRIVDFLLTGKCFRNSEIWRWRTMKICNFAN